MPRLNLDQCIVGRKHVAPLGALMQCNCCERESGRVVWKVGTTGGTIVAATSNRGGYDHTVPDDHGLLTAINGNLDFCSLQTLPRDDHFVNGKLSVLNTIVAQHLCFKR